MGNIFKNRKNCMYSEAAYYRLMLPFIVDEERILHLDGDTLTFSDLNELYNVDFNDNYILGFYDYWSWGIDYLGIKSKIYINSGVILLNLKKIREENKDLELVKLPFSHIKLTKDDQTVFNYLLYPKIGRLPSKYVTFNFEDKNDIIFYSKFLRTNISIEEMEDALKNPIIIHNVICSPKVWYSNTQYIKGASTCSQRKNCSCIKYFDLWHHFAKQTEYYEKILKFTIVKN
jgi:lipopolysaccharide biosynthesis glycosyltransferase